MPVADDASFWRAVLLGGAIGDALGAGVEFLSLAAIQKRFGRSGITELVEYDGRLGAITDDTQMTLFTAEALLGAQRRSSSYGIASFENALYYSYLRWLATQGERAQLKPGARPLELRGLLWDCPDLHHRRSPGTTCLSALHVGEYGTPAKPFNQSKGCGGVMRAAPGALWGFEAGKTIAAITHGHPTGYLAAGAFVVILDQLKHGNGLEAAVEAALEKLRDETRAEETVHALRRARELAKSDAPDALATTERLGGGWIAEEALAIAVFAAWRADGDFGRGVRLAVNHSGDSDSTGAIAGNLLGALCGEAALPARWVEPLEARAVLVQVAADLAAGPPSDEDSTFLAHAARYPYC